MKIPSYLYKKKYSGVYCIENSLNRKRYIGSSSFIYQRLHRHKTFLQKQKHENKHLQNSWNKNGEDKFECYVVEFCEEKDLCIVEQKWINELNPEYNITKEVVRNTPSEESRKKISNSLKKGHKEGRIKPTKTSPITAFNLKGDKIGDFSTIRECGKILKIHPTSIIRVLKGIYKQTKGYTFIYQAPS